MEEEGETIGKSLLELESEMRACAKGDPSLMLTPKVINLRREVERQRQVLRQLHLAKEEMGRRKAGLEQELRTIESAEKRRNEVALETERSLTEAKFEIN